MSEEQPRRRRRRARAAETTGTDEVPTAARDVEPVVPARDAAVARDPAEVTVVATPAGLLHRTRIDPAVGLGIFVPGLFVMALGGAATWHWIFNIGEAVMLAGMTIFVGAVILTALQQRDLRKVAAAPASPARREASAASAEPATAES